MFKILIKNDALTRYDLSKFLKFYDMFDILDSEFLYRIDRLHRFGRYIVKGEEFRPDLLAESIYGIGYTQFWYIIMYINGFASPLDITTGLTVKFPYLEDLETIYFTLVPTSDQNIIDSTITVIE